MLSLLLLVLLLLLPLCLADASQSAQHRCLPVRGSPVLHGCVGDLFPRGDGLPHCRRGRRLRHRSLRRGPPLGAWLVVAVGDTRALVGRPGRLPARLYHVTCGLKKKKLFQVKIPCIKFCWWCVGSAPQRFVKTQLSHKNPYPSPWKPLVTISHRTPPPRPCGMEKFTVVHFYGGP